DCLAPVHEQLRSCSLRKTVGRTPCRGALWAGTPTSRCRNNDISVSLGASRPPGASAADLGGPPWGPPHHECRRGGGNKKGRHLGWPNGTKMEGKERQRASHRPRAPPAPRRDRAAGGRG